MSKQREKWVWVKDRWNGGYSGLFDQDDNPVLVPQCRNDGDTGASWFDIDGDAGAETLTEGNASLIAAAPEMLALLQELEFCYESEVMGEVRKFCPVCITLEGHDEDCMLGNLLKKLKR